MDNAARESVLAGHELARERFSVRENTSLGLIRLQAFHRKAGNVDAVARQLGLPLPRPCQSARDEDMQLFWSAPGEWILASPAGSEREIAQLLQSRLDNSALAVTSVVTDSRVTLELGGAAVRDVLARGSTLDFHPSQFGAGRCVTTRFAGIPAMLTYPEGGEGFLLFADRSLGHYLLDWFAAASADCVAE
ncbi:MAG: sarcosine oxidase subunit gamma family protein [Pseudomonadota bacterium]